MLLLSAMGLVAYVSISELVRAQDAATVTNTNIARIDRVRERTSEAEAAVRLYAERGDSASLSAVGSAQADVEYALDSLLAASEDHPVQRRNIDSLGPIVGARFRSIRQVAQARTRQAADSAVAMLGAEGPRRGMARLLVDMRNEEVLVLGERTRVMADNAKSTQVLVVVGSLFSLVLALVALQPLRASVERRVTQRLTVAPHSPTTRDRAGE